MQNIVFGLPPMFAEINARFHVRGKPVIFSWGDMIYNPTRITIPPQLMVHEAMHGERQEQHGVEDWWRDYIDSPAFRLEEEILAHQVEYRYLMRESANRRARRSGLKQVAKRLAGPLYGGMISPAKAQKLLLDVAVI